MQDILNIMDLENQNESQQNIRDNESKDKKEGIFQKSQTKNEEKENTENKTEEVDETKKYFDENETLLEKKKNRK